MSMDAIFTESICSRLAGECGRVCAARPRALCGNPTCQSATAPTPTSTATSAPTAPSSNFRVLSISLTNMNLVA